MKSEFTYESGVEEEAFPEPRLVKRIIIKRDLILNNRLEDYRNELPFGLLVDEKKKTFCNALLGLYEILKPKLDDKKNKKTYEIYKKLDDVEKYLSDSYSMVNLDMKKLIEYKALLESFIEKIGITKIEVVMEHGDMLRGLGKR